MSPNIIYTLFMSEWTVETLKEHLEGILLEKEKANNQRFTAQETAIDKAEFNRDTAIKKAEDSIEKKSDAVYVKLTDLQKAFSEVMLRPEIEGRLKAVEKYMNESSGKSSGLDSAWKILLGALSGAAIIYGILK